MNFRKLPYLITGVFIFSLVLGIGAFLYLSTDLPTIEQISLRRVSQSTKIYDRTGEILLYEISNGRERTVVPLEKIPQHLKDATIAIEDRRFYEEAGFDTRGILRALWTNLKQGNPLEGQGASTITQQLARNAFLTSERTITRKIKELILAVRINRRYLKDEILALYLNEIPYGPTVYGVEAASRAYFGKQAKGLNLAESAILAALPKAPTYYSPWGNHASELFARQEVILEKMLQLGKITEDEFQKALNFKIVFQKRDTGIKAPHFVLNVQDYLVQKYGEVAVREGGLFVKTTLDWEMQELAEKVVKKTAEENDRLYDGKNAALVAEDTNTGEILALVGSRDYFATSSLPDGCAAGIDCQFEPNFNVATQGLRQPGSALKPFAYLVAMEKGYTPETVVFDVPTEFTADHPDCPPIPDFKNDKKDCFHPENFDGIFRGPVSLRQALGQSINIPAVKVLYLAGLSDVVKRANDFGLESLTSPELYGLSLVLGGGAVRLIDLVGAYSALAEEGVKYEQKIVLEVKDSDDNILESNISDLKVVRVAKQQFARTINDILSDIEVRSGLFRNSLHLTTFPNMDVALKTGTSDDYRDAWAIGYTPSLVVGVWAGNNNNLPMKQRGSSLLAAVPIWSRFMDGVINKLPLETFNRPEPTTTQKPILMGSYIYNNELHSILYYVDRKNPSGPPPLNPLNDSQFLNWETSLLHWAENNVENFDINQGGAVGLVGNYYSKPNILIKSPTPGSFVGNEIDLVVEITSESAIEKINIHWNKIKIQGFQINQTQNYTLRQKIAVPNPERQNLLEVEVVDKNGKSFRSEVIVYN